MDPVVGAGISTRLAIASDAVLERHARETPDGSGERGARDG